MTDKIGKVLKKIWDWGRHLLIIGILGVAFLPIARWYLEKMPLLGTDFFLTKTYVSYLERFFTLRPDGWKYIWSAGYPLARDYPTLHIYLILPFLKFFSQIQAIQIYMVISTFLFGLFAYLLFHQLSGSRLLSLILAIGCFYSVGFYGSLIWGGGLPFYASQFFLPLVLWLIVRHLEQKETEKRSYKSLVLAGFLAGLSFLAHAQAPVSSIVPLGLILILFWNSRQIPFFSKRKLLDGGLFLAVVVVAGFSFIRPYFVPIFNLLFGAATRGAKVYSPTGDAGYNLQWELDQLQRVWTDSSEIFGPAMIIAFVFLLLGLLIGRRIPAKIWLLLPLAGWFGFMFFSLVLWVYRLNPLQGGWYRAFWAFSLIYGSVVAALWGAGSEIMGVKRFGKLVSPVFGLLVLIFLAGFGFRFYANFFDRLEKGGNPSSAFPKIMNISVTREEEEAVKKKMVPSWLDSNDQNHRLFSLDVGLNIGWNSYFNLPLFQGYTDPPIPFVGRGYLYLADITLAKDEVVERFGYTADEAKNLARFIIDWSAIRYFEGDISERLTQAPISTYLEDFIKRDEMIEFKNVLAYVDYALPKTSLQYNRTHYYEFNDDLVSPIIEGNNATTIAVVGKFVATDMLTRAIAAENIGSKRLVTIIGPEFIDEWSLEDYQKFDAVFLYAYDYKNYQKAWEIIGQYVKQGGKLFVDTGGDTKETASKKLPADRFPQELPELFPIHKTNKDFFGKNWDFAVGESDLVRGIELENFGPAEIDGQVWGVSFAEPDELRGNAIIILKNKGKIVMAEKSEGKGRIIWSGLNLPYHIGYYRKEAERKLLIRLLGDLVLLDSQESPKGEVQWISPENRKIVLTDGAKGVLFREYLFDGWRVTVINSQGDKKSVRIYPAGPAYPGYMYVSLPENMRGNNLTVEFKFHGKFTDWLEKFLTIFCGLLILDYILLGGKLLVGKLSRFSHSFHKKTISWWEKEEY